MSPRLVTVLTFVAAAVVLGLYVLFVAWRYRAEKRRKAMAVSDASVEDRVLDRLAAAAPTSPRTKAKPEPRSEPAPAPRPEPALTPGAPAPSSVGDEQPAPRARPADATVADMLTGIRLPADLVPLLSVAPRTDVGDRVAFWTKGLPEELVTRDFSAELMRLGYAVAAPGDGALRAERDGATLFCRVHAKPAIVNIGGRQAFPTVPEDAVVVEVWVPLLN